MIANYHTHTPRCTHAVGTEEEYVIAGIEAGLKLLGFADHAPYPFAGGFYSHIRMRPDELEEYAQSVFAMRQKYGDKIRLPLGVEIEYFPQFWDEQLSMLRDAGVEYLLLGQHWSEYVEGIPYNGKPTDDETLLAGYCACVRQAMQTGLLTYIAHPDMFNWKGSDNVYRRHMQGLCRDAKNCGIPLEINMVGIRTGRNYPNSKFWELAAEEGCKAVLGCDAHNPMNLLNTDAITVAQEIVRTFDLELLETVPLQRF